MKPLLHSITGFFINKRQFRTLFLGGLFLLMAEEGWGQITTTALHNSPVCVGSTILVDFTSIGSFNPTNDFIAELSDPIGNYYTPTAIGSIPGPNAGSFTISATIPIGTSGGTGYRIRVVSSDPALTGTDLPVTINVIPSAPTGTAAQSFCAINNPTVANIAITATGTVIWYDAATLGTVVPPATALVSGTTYYASQTISGCESDTRLAVAVTVADPLPPTGNGAQSFCAINNPTVANIAITATGTVIWYDAATLGTVVPPATALVSGTTYYASQTISGCESDTRLAVAVTVADPLPPTGNGAQSFCAINNPTVANIAITATGTVIWYDAATLGTVVPPATALVSGTTYYASQTISGCESDTRLAVAVTVADPLPPTGNGAQSFCAINNPTVANIAITATGTVIWYDAATLGTVVPPATALVSGTTYYASQTISGCESDTRLAVAVTVADPLPPTGNGAQSFCAINNPTVANIAITATGTVIWYDAATLGTVVPPATALVSGTTYYASQTISGCESDTRLAVAVTVADPLPPTGNGAQSFCAINNPTVANIAITATGTVIWYDAATLGTVVPPATALVSGTTYYASQTISGCESDTRLAVAVTVADPLPPTGNGAQSFCAINNPTVANIAITATGTVIWYDAATLGTVVPPATALVSGTTYYASQTISGCESDTRLAVAVTVADPLPPTGNGAQSFCAINNPTVANIAITATGTVIWYDAATLGTVVPPATALVSGTTYYASQTISGCESDTRLAVAVTVADPLPPTGNGAQSFCAINNPTVANIAITATGTVIWYDAATLGTVVPPATALVSGTTYYASQTISGCESDTRLAVAVTVADPLPPTGNGAQSFCAINNPTVANIAITATGTVIWYDAATLGTVVPPATALVSGTTYYASQTISGCESDTRLAVAVTVADPLPPTGNGAQSFCAINNPTVANIAITATGTVIWYDAATLGTVVPPATALVSGTTYYASQTISGCESDTRLAVAVTVADPLPPTGNGAQSFCAINNPTVANIAITATGTVIWYDAATLGTVVPPATALVSGTTYYASQTISGCESDTRLAVAVTVADPLPPTGNGAQSFCAINNPTVANIAITATGTVIWYDAATLGTVVPPATALVSGTTYYASQTISGCESDTRLAVAVTVADPLPPTGNGAQSFCAINNPTVANIAITATGTVIWYDAATLGTVVPPATALVSGTTYYASQTISGCESDTRLAVAVTVADPLPPTGNGAQSFCAINNPTVANIAITATGTVIWYDAATLGTVVPPATALVSGTTYYASQTISGCESDTRLAVAVTVADPLPPTGNGAQSFCAINNPTVANIAITATGTVIWYDAATLGTVVPPATALVSGTTYYASQTISGCESDTRLAVAVTVADPLPPTGNGAQSFCAINNPTVANIAITATGTVIWYDAATLGTVVPPATALVSGTTYYASQTISGCESDTRLAVAVTVADPLPPTGNGAQSFCAINNPTVANIAITATGTVIWYDAATLGTVVPPATALVSGTTYYASQTISGCESDTRLAVAVTVADPLPPTGNGAQSFCAINNPTVANIAITATGTVIWYDAATLGTVVPPATALVSGTTYYASQTISGCESDTRLAVAVTVADPLPPTGNGAQSFCAINNPTVANIAITATGTVIWYDAATLGTVVPPATALVSGTTYYASQTISGCESDTRLAVAVTVADPLPPTGNGAQSFCAINNPTVANIAITATGTVIWYDAATLGTVVPPATALVSGTTYYASQTISGCESDTRLAVAVTVADPSVPTVTTPVLYCQNATAIALTATGTNLLWYTVSTGGTGSSTAPAPSTSLSGTTSYWVSQTVNGCEGPRSEIVVTVNALPIATIVCSYPDHSFFAGASVTFTAGGGTFYNFLVDGLSMQNGSSNTYSTNTLTDGQEISVIVTTGNGCSSTSEGITVNVITLPVGWNINPPDFSSSGQVTARVSIDFTPVESGFLAAFKGEQCRGLVNTLFIEATGQYLFGLICYSNNLTPDTLTFRYYDPGADKIYYMDTSVVFVPDMITGTLLDPVEMNNTIDYSVSFPVGWSWFSVNAVLDNMTLNNVLTKGISDGDYIKDQISFSSYYKSLGGWVGSLSQINPTKLYKIQIHKNCNLNFRGTPINTDVTPISLVKGWNWIGYLSKSILPINTALSSLSPVTLDYIKSQTQFSQYVAGSGWLGTLTNLKPSEGYMLQVKNPGTIFYPFVFSGKGSQITSEDSDNYFNASEYEFNGSMMARIYVKGYSSGSVDNLLFAYAGNQIRGVAKGIYIEKMDCYIYPLMIHSNKASGEKIEFRYYDSLTGEYYLCKEILYFEKDMIVADVFNPLGLNAISNLVTTIDDIVPSFGFRVFPNPFGQVLNVEYELPETNLVRITVNDPGGKVVRVLVNQNQEPGHHSVQWFPQTETFGIYFIKYQAGSIMKVQKVMFMP